MKQQPEFIYPLRIYIDDTDFGGIMYHANYLKYFERARSEWAEQIGLGIDWQRANNIYFTVRYANVEFLKPARLHEQVEVVSKINEARTASIIYDQYLRSAATPDTIFCTAKIKIACVGPDIRPCPIPERFFEILMESKREH